MTALRFLAAAVATAVVSPCLGFGIFGLLASQEPGAGIGWTIGYLVFDTILVALIIAIWWLAFRRTRGPTDCLGCGYDLRGVRDGACPECGATAN